MDVKVSQSSSLQEDKTKVVASESSQREKAQSSMQQEDKLKCVFLMRGKRSQGLHGFHGIDISRTTR